MTSHEKQKTNKKRNNKFIVNLTKMNSDINENLSDNLILKCWLCKSNCRLMDCSSFKNRSISATRQFVKQHKLCFNCLSKTHIVKIVSRASFAAERTATKKHQTLLHEPPNVNVNNNLINDLCTENEYLQREVLHLEKIENFSKTELSCNKIKTRGKITQQRIYKFYP